MNLVKLDKGAYYEIPYRALVTNEFVNFAVNAVAWDEIPANIRSYVREG